MERTEDWQTLVENKRKLTWLFGGDSATNLLVTLGTSLNMTGS